MRVPFLGLGSGLDGGVPYYGVCLKNGGQKIVSPYGVSDGTKML